MYCIDFLYTNTAKNVFYEYIKPRYEFPVYCLILLILSTHRIARIINPDRKLNYLSVLPSSHPKARDFVLNQGER